MNVADKDLSSLGTRPVFNKTLRHIVNVTNLIDSVDKGANLADLLNKLIQDGIMRREQISPILSVVLVGKFEYPYISRNVKESRTDFDKIIESFSKWNNVDMVIAYHHPNLGVLAVNPRNPNHWAEIHELKVEELLVVYAKTKNRRPETGRKAVEAFLALLDGKEPVVDPDFIDVQVKEEPKVIPKVEVPQTSKNLTPKYSVQVTNELFHNGNVEAWKNVVESYEIAHPGCRVIVFHEGELIQDLNSLFKWGKVKHGGVIFFQVAGNNIKNVSRLQKYLHEGASKRYETFIKQDVYKTLNLF